MDALLGQLRLAAAAFVCGAGLMVLALIAADLAHF
jgi:hypothetical protein